ncbi:MAG: N-acetylneuraminate synthase [Pseudoalteromonas sp.]|uniref:N-acetylneuraminate synthase n=1 Tax=Pseudoalteromonas sp. TaxID=53249 RepID=UPI003F956FC1
MTLIIAEAGVNHNGSDELAFSLVDAAYRAGADIVKFQTFKAKNLVTEDAQQAEYQITNSGQKESQFSMLKRLELSYESHHKLVKYCNDLGIEFLSTAFDSESLSFLVDDLGITRLKLPSGEITNAPLVLEHARTGCDLIVSTGMATLSEIEQVLSVIAFGYLNPEGTPNDETLQAAYFSEQGKQLLKEKVTLLHCTTEYPAPFGDINLNAMDTMKDAFKLAIGYSDHSEGIIVPVAAVAKGAVLIEKHFTVDKSLPGPDHKASLDPQELKAMVDGIRTVEKVLGDGIKGPRPSEVKNKSVTRKSLVAANAITAGELFSENNLAVKRPGSGINPIKYWHYLNKASSKNYQAGDLIDE